jgi:hypothetical protein
MKPAIHISAMFIPLVIMEGRAAVGVGITCDVDGAPLMDRFQPWVRQFGSMFVSVIVLVAKVALADRALP